MEPFATVQELEARWRPLSTAEQDRAEVLLEDASARLRATCADIDDRIADETLDPAVPRMIVCDMVKRAMVGGADAGAGVSSTQDTVGPFSRSLSYSNPMGDLYLTKQEKKLLGCGAQKAFEVDPLDGYVAPWSPHVGW